MHFVVVAHHQQTRPAPATSVITRRGLSQLNVLHQPLERFAARSKAIYWLRIALSAYPTCIQRPC